jgi:hypothetical protein
MTNKFPVKKPVSADTWPISMWSPQQMLCVVPIHFNTTFRSLPHRGAHSVENSWFHLKLLTGILYLVLNTRTPKSLDVPATKKFGGLRSGDHAGQLTRPPRHVHCSSKVWFMYCVTMRRKWGGAPPCLRHMWCLWWRGTCSKIAGIIIYYYYYYWWGGTESLGICSSP